MKTLWKPCSPWNYHEATQRQFYICPFSLFLTIRNTSPNLCSRNPAKAYQSLVLGWAWKIHPEILPATTLNFTGSKVQNLASIFNPSCLWHSQFQNEAKYQKQKNPPGRALMVDVLMQKFCTPPIIFKGSQTVWNMKQSNISKTKNTR